MSTSPKKSTNQPPPPPSFQERNYLSDNAEAHHAARLIVSAAAQRLDDDTLAILERIQPGALGGEDGAVASDLATVKMAIRSGNTQLRAVVEQLQEHYGFDADPWALADYVQQLNAQWFKFRRDIHGLRLNPDEFAATRCTDVANGIRFAQQYAGTALHSSAHGWLSWDGRRWARDEKAAREMAKKIPDVIRQEIKALAEAADTADREECDRLAEYIKALNKHAKASAQTRGVDNTLKEAKTTREINADHIEFDADPWALNCKNGVVDLRTGELHEHDPALHITKLVPHEYNPEAACPRWLRFLAEVFCDDRELIEWVSWLVGYSFTGSVHRHLFPVLHGSGRNGKGAFFRAIRNALGEDYCTIVNPEDLLIQHGNRSPGAVAKLRGARFAYAQETDQGRRLNESVIKTLTGGDVLVDRHLYGNLFEFKPTHKLWIASNYKPRVHGGAAGLWDRLRLIPFTRRFEDHEQDPHLDDTLAREAEGILAWAVKAARMPEPSVPNCVRAATDEYREDSDTIAAFLAEAACEWEHATVSKSRFYNAYQKYTNHHCESMKDFNRRLAERGFTDKRTKEGMCWIGVALNAQWASGCT